MKPRSAPTMRTDKETEAFLDQDLSDLDLTAFKPLTWEAEPKTARVNTAPRSPSSTPSRPAPPSAPSPDQRLIHEAIERAVRR